MMLRAWVKIRENFAYLLLSVAPLLITCDFAIGAQLVGEVIAVTDGDTIKVLDASKSVYKIRLAGIDAPESHQAFGEKSHQNLAALVFRKSVVIEWEKVDRYGRIVGKVLLQNEDINLKQIEIGLAWHYKQFAKDQSTTDQRLYAVAESRARDERRGLWQDAAPIPPWEWRKSRRSRK